MGVSGEMDIGVGCIIRDDRGAIYRESDRTSKGLPILIKRREGM